MRKLLLLLLMISVEVFVAQTSSDLFSKANAEYKNENYQEAINLYQQIEEHNVVSSSLYYNLGNCFYKLNDVANTIYYYEKALLLNPLNEDVTNNLEFAKRMTIDNIEALPKTFLQKLKLNYIQKFSYNQWAIITVILSFFTALFFLFFYFSGFSNKKRIYFLISILSFILLIISTTISYNQHNIYINTRAAIIFSPKVIIKNAPTINSEEIFTLHEGTKISILDSVDNWKKIKLADGKVGWISADDLKEL